MTKKNNDKLIVGLIEKGIEWAKKLFYSPQYEKDYEELKSIVVNEVGKHYDILNLIINDKFDGRNILSKRQGTYYKNKGFNRYVISIIYDYFGSYKKFHKEENPKNPNTPFETMCINILNKFIIPINIENGPGTRIRTDLCEPLEIYRMVLKCANTSDNLGIKNIDCLGLTRAKYLAYKHGSLDLIVVYELLQPHFFALTRKLCPIIENFCNKYRIKYPLSPERLLFLEKKLLKTTVSHSLESKSKERDERLEIVLKYFQRILPEKVEDAIDHSNIMRVLDGVNRILENL